MKPMSWGNVCHWIAQAVVNIDEGIMGPIEKDSHVHHAMSSFCTYVNEGLVKFEDDPKQISLDYGSTFMSAEEVPAFVIKHAWDAIFEAMKQQDLSKTHAAVVSQKDAEDPFAIDTRRKVLAAFLENAEKDLVLG